MRVLPNTHIWDVWSTGGPFTGPDGATHGRVTVEREWSLQATPSQTIGSYTKGPIRYFQLADNSQIESEIPNIKSIQIDRSIDTDAGTCTIVMLNQWMYSNGTASPDDELGQPGYFTFNRGDSVDAQSRWNHANNEWRSVIVPNALIRTYQGYGGTDKSIIQALQDGNIIQTGLWLVDEVRINTNGEIEIRCRDTGKLVIDQSVFPPLVPAANYPVTYFRWKIAEVQVQGAPYAHEVRGYGYTPQQPVSASASSSAPANGSTTYVPANAIDFANLSTYWLSDGHATSTGSDAFEWIEFDLGGTADFGAFNIEPYGAGLNVYISVMTGGQWVNKHGNIPTTNAGMNIPYAHFVIVGDVGGVFQMYDLEPTGNVLTVYNNVQKVRLTFTRLTKSGIGPYYYRAGVKDFNYGTFAGFTDSQGYIICAGDVASSTTNAGYLMLGTDGGVYAFGEATNFGSHKNYNRTIDQLEVDIAALPDGKGYYVLTASGRIYPFGAAHYYGSPIGPNNQVLDTSIIRMAVTPSQKGYYVLNWQGHVYTYGDAVWHGNGPTGSGAFDIGIMPDNSGYWIMYQDGTVMAFGGAVHYGNANETGARGMAVTPTGHGYWTVHANGRIHAMGDAVYYGDMFGHKFDDPPRDMAAVADGTGYWIFFEDGDIRAYGSAKYQGWLPLTQYYFDRTDGNYFDYADIIKDLLLWSGFWLYPTLENTTNVPSVFGNIESTGAFAQDIITQDFFDKKPVIDVIHSIKEIVGYIFYIDDIGAAHFESPNIWQIGNIYETGEYTTFVPDIDETVQLSDYTVSAADKDARSEIIISSDDPFIAMPSSLADPGNVVSTTVTTVRTSSTGSAALRGIVRPALWINGLFLSKEEQETMAELVDLHLFMASRQGSVSCAANPALQINDQIRIWERQTSESYVHYIRGYSTTMNLEEGEYTMTINTHWLGDGNSWFLEYN